MSAPAATTPAVVVGGREVSIPDLLEVTSGYVAGLPSRTYMGLHHLCRVAAARVLGLDLHTDDGHRRAVAVADRMCWAVAEHLLHIGQHPQPDTRRTVADWLLSASLSVVQDELIDAARWWRSLQRWERLP